MLARIQVYLDLDENPLSFPPGFLTDIHSPAQRLLIQADCCQSINHYERAEMPDFTGCNLENR